MADSIYYNNYNKLIGPNYGFASPYGNMGENLLGGNPANNAALEKKERNYSVDFSYLRYDQNRKDGYRGNFYSAGVSGKYKKVDYFAGAYYGDLKQTIEYIDYKTMTKQKTRNEESKTGVNLAASYHLPWFDVLFGMTGVVNSLKSGPNGQKLQTSLASGDLGLVINNFFTKGLALGLDIKSLGPGFKVSNVFYQLPTIWSAGVSYTNKTVEGQMISAAFDLRRGVYDKFVQYSAAVKYGFLIQDIFSITPEFRYNYINADGKNYYHRILPGLLLAVNIHQVRETKIYEPIQARIDYDYLVPDVGNNVPLDFVKVTLNKDYNPKCHLYDVELKAPIFNNSTAAGVVFQVTDKNGKIREKYLRVKKSSNYEARTIIKLRSGEYKISAYYVDKNKQKISPEYKEIQKVGICYFFKEEKVTIKDWGLPLTIPKKDYAELADLLAGYQRERENVLEGLDINEFKKLHKNELCFDCFKTIQDLENVIEDYQAVFFIYEHLQNNEKLEAANAKAKRQLARAEIPLKRLEAKKAQAEKEKKDVFDKNFKDFCSKLDAIAKKYDQISENLLKKYRVAESRDLAHDQAIEFNKWSRYYTDQREKEGNLIQKENAKKHEETHFYYEAIFEKLEKEMVPQRAKLYPLKSEIKDRQDKIDTNNKHIEEYLNKTINKHNLIPELLGLGKAEQLQVIYKNEKIFSNRLERFKAWQYKAYKITNYAKAKEILSAQYAKFREFLSRNIKSEKLDKIGILPLEKVNFKDFTDKAELGTKVSFIIPRLGRVNWKKEKGSVVLEGEQLAAYRKLKDERKQQAFLLANKAHPKGSVMQDDTIKTKALKVNPNQWEYGYQNFYIDFFVKANLQKDFGPSIKYKKMGYGLEAGFKFSLF